MKRTGQMVILALLACALRAEWASAQWAVIDGSNLLQNTTTAFNSVKQVYNSSQQLIAEYNIFRNTVTQIENQVKNLQHIPKGLNLFDTIMTYGNRIAAVAQCTPGSQRHGGQDAVGAHQPGRPL